MKVFKGWYRQSLTKGRWHLVFHVSSIMDGNPIATTTCRRKIPAKKCDFDSNPDNKCILCEEKEINGIIDSLAIRQ